MLDSYKFHSDVDSIKVSNIVTCKLNSLQKYVWEIFHVEALQKRELIYLMSELKLLSSSFFRSYSSVMPLEGFTSKLNEDRLKE